MKDQQLKKRMWKPEEDLILKRYVEIHGEGNWSAVSKKLGLRRGGKSCRLRWKNYLRPDIKHGSMSKDEEDLIIRMHKLIGNRWSLIAGRLPGRTDNDVKNYWNTHMSKKANRQAKIKPSTHMNEMDESHESDQQRAKKGRFDQSEHEHHHGSTQERNNDTVVDGVVGVKEEKINHNESKEEENWSSLTGELLVGSDSGNLSCGIMDMDFVDDGNAFMICGGEYDDKEEPLGLAWDHADDVLFDTLGSNWVETFTLP